MAHTKIRPSMPRARKKPQKAKATKAATKGRKVLGRGMTDLLPMPEVGSEVIRRKFVPPSLDRAELASRFVDSMLRNPYALAELAPKAIAGHALEAADQLVRDLGEPPVSDLERDLVSLLSSHAGETGESEGAVEVLRRLIRERGDLQRELALARASIPTEDQPMLTSTSSSGFDPEAGDTSDVVPTEALTTSNGAAAPSSSP